MFGQVITKHFRYPGIGFQANMGLYMCVIPTVMHVSTSSSSLCAVCVCVYIYVRDGSGVLNELEAHSS